MSRVARLGRGAMSPLAVDGESRAGTRCRRVMRLLGSLIVLFGFTALATAGASLAGKSNQAVTRNWNVEATPNPAIADISFLSSVSCVPRGVCTAVGGFSQTLSSSSGTLAERWDGKR